jgi:hypothetical protein
MQTIIMYKQFVSMTRIGFEEDSDEEDQEMILQAQRHKEEMAIRA